jgi:hypothetical protein
MFQRLGFEEGQRVGLRPIFGIGEAKKFANAYIEFERAQSPVPDRSPRMSYSDIVSDDELEDVLEEVSDTDDLLKAKVNQAFLLEALHRKVEEKHSRS